MPLSGILISADLGAVADNIGPQFILLMPTGSRDACWHCRLFSLALIVELKLMMFGSDSLRCMLTRSPDTCCHCPASPGTLIMELTFDSGSVCCAPTSARCPCPAFSHALIVEL
eukprot:TRINITY_DN11741_c1_g4_i1.p2 TRINITY_DN11741_c1_g4~~TRINITY_DN11741_c1_g4_i1.p2  ORF type:complete len:114 (+),score=12.66 TRINITY_DN11741_c1_g4_i1:143-484(+)